MCSRSSLWLAALAFGLLLTSPMACNEDHSACHPAAETCDGVDNDCDGLTDEEVADCCTSGESRPCGVAQGACHQGTQTCSPGRAWGACLDAAQQPVVLPGTVAESCNGVDDDCDGQTDEADASGCASYYADQDGDGYGTGPAQCLCAAAAPYTVQQDGDCDDGDPNVHPGATETCDAKDQDCDGETDEGVPGCCAAHATQSCGVNRGVCQAGTQTCGDDRAWGSCLDASLQPVVSPGQRQEVCNGADDDCDGVTDEGFDAGFTCTAGVGACQTSGLMICASETTTTCDAQPGVPGLEVCDGLDNDCDGQIDEDLPGCCAVGTTRACGVSQGVCTAGTQTCTAQRAWGSCLDSQGQAVVLPGDQAELCNGIDDDCDGQTDEPDGDGFIAGDKPLCEVQIGVCSGARKPAALCVSGSWQACDASAYHANDARHEAPVELSCDGLDNDCDGQTDEDFGLILRTGATVSGAGKVCGVGRCAGGVTTCKSDKTGIVCPSEANATNEVCNNLDDDCNGSTDEAGPGGFMTYDQPLCENQHGVCAGARKAAALCVSGSWLTCNTADYQANSASYETGSEAACDGLDNDCDGATDEGLRATYYRDADGDGYGSSSMTTQDCSQPVGYVTNSFDCDDSRSSVHVGAVELCNGRDDDCDGATDEGFLLGVACDGPDADLCKTGTYTCKVDGTGAECVNESQPNQTELCGNGIDDDCDGETDEPSCVAP